MSVASLPASSTWKAELHRYPEVTPRELPEAIGSMVDYLRPVAVMFPHDWCPMLALTFWSVLVPGATRVENLGLNLWFLGINPQGSGKNITSDRLYEVAQRLSGLGKKELEAATKN